MEIEFEDRDMHLLLSATYKMNLVPCRVDGVLWQRERWGRCAGHSGHGGRGRGAMEPRHHVREVTSGE